MKKAIIIIIVIAILASIGYYFYSKNKSISNVPIKIETAVVKIGDISKKVLSTGVIQPFTRVEVRPPIAGRIDEVKINERDKVKQGDILAWISSEERIILIDGAKSDLQKAKISGNSEQIKNAEKALEIASKAYKPVAIITSISGEVINRSCEPGQNVSSADVIFVISDRLVAAVDVDEADIGSVYLGQKTYILLDAYPEEKIEGKVTKIAREGKNVSGVVYYTVSVDADSIPPYWSSGMTANVEFVVTEKLNIPLIPKSSIKNIEGKQMVRLHTTPPKSIEIQIGVTDGKSVEVVNGLSVGDTIVISEEYLGQDSNERSLFMRRRR